VVNTAGERLKLFIMVGSLEEARHAVEECGADVLVVQGSFHSALFALRKLEQPSQALKLAATAFRQLILFLHCFLPSSMHSQAGALLIPHKQPHLS
jgi:hypothetical protein